MSIVTLLCFVGAFWSLAVWGGLVHRRDPDEEGEGGSLAFLLIGIALFLLGTFWGLFA